jgi:integrase/recombinase XerD
MSTALYQALEDYLSLHRSLGRKYADQSTQLPQFVAYVEAAGATTVTTDLALAWAIQPSGTLSSWWARRLAMVRGFARYLKAIDPDTEIPPVELLPYECRRVDPYLYSDADIAALMAAARSLRSPLRAATYETLIGLIAATGMRSGEAVRLDRDDIDWNEGVITIWRSKFGKSRALPVHPTTLAALARYGEIRDWFISRPEAPSFFVSTVGTRLNNDDDKTFRHLVREVGLASPSGRAPRLHDLRHRFAVRTLVNWYRAGVDVEAHMPLLSTYLGHACPRHTFWYLSAVPELLFLAADRLERVEEQRS